jgi:POT family proton-dependent oligopeptide transporter
VVLGSLIFVPICALLLNLDEVMSTTLLIISIGIIGYMIYQGVTNEKQSRGAQRLLVVVVLFFSFTPFFLGAI